MYTGEKLTFAFAKISGGITLSGPKACRGSTKEARILPAFLHSPIQIAPVSGLPDQCGEIEESLTAQRRGERVMNPERHIDKARRESKSNGQAGEGGMSGVLMEESAACLMERVGLRSMGATSGADYRPGATVSNWLFVCFL